MVKQGARAAVTRHDLQPVSAKIGDQDVAIGGKRQAIGQRTLGELALQITRRRRRGIAKAVTGTLANEGLASIMPQAHHATARIRAPQRTIRLCQDALRALQVGAQIADRRALHGEAVDRVDALGHWAAPGLRSMPAMAGVLVASMRVTAFHASCARNSGRGRDRYGREMPGRVAPPGACAPLDYRRRSAGRSPWSAFARRQRGDRPNHDKRP